MPPPASFLPSSTDHDPRVPRSTDLWKLGTLTVTHARIIYRRASSCAMPAVDDETSDEEREEDRGGGGERCRVFARVTRGDDAYIADRVDDTVEALQRAARGGKLVRRPDLDR